MAGDRNCSGLDAYVLSGVGERLPGEEYILVCVGQRLDPERRAADSPKPFPSELVASDPSKRNLVHLSLPCCKNGRYAPEGKHASRRFSLDLPLAGVSLVLCSLKSKLTRASTSVLCHRQRFIRVLRRWFRITAWIFVF